VESQYDLFVVSAVCFLSTTPQFTEEEWVATNRVKNIEFPFCSLAAPGFYSDYYKHFLREEYFNAIFSLSFSASFTFSVFLSFFPSFFLSHFHLFYFILFYFIYLSHWRTEGGLEVFKPPPRNYEGPPKSCQTQPDCENC